MYRHFLPWTTKIPNIKNSYFCTGQIYNTICNTQFRTEHQDRICSKGALTPNWTVFVRTYVRTYVRVYVTLENIVHSISRGRTVTKCWNLVCVCNMYQWWHSDLNIPGNSQQSRFSELLIFLWEFDYFKSWVALISIFRSIAIVAFLSRIVHS